MYTHKSKHNFNKYFVLKLLRKHYFSVNTFDLKLCFGNMSLVQNFEILYFRLNEIVFPNTILV